MSEDPLFLECPVPMGFTHGKAEDKEVIMNLNICRPQGIVKEESFVEHP
jgi:hypothetical protein